MRMYETIYIVKPDLADEETKAINAKVQEIIDTKAGEIKKLEDWGLRKLAYPINKVSRGRYMYLRYDGSPEMIAELERRLRLDERILRFQSVKLEKEVVAAAPAKQAEPVEEAVAAPQETETESA
jgi:small subunit ribosomal protein S6